jgi:hypothetical protein
VNRISFAILAQMFFGLERFASGLVFDVSELIWVEAYRSGPSQARQPIKNKQFFFLKNGYINLP